MSYDCIIRGGRVIDPSQDLDAVCDVGVSGGVIAAIEPSLPTDGAEVIDAGDRIVTPGLVDLHTHVYWGATHWGIEADPSCLAKGVTTVFDAGSAGARNFPAFERFIIRDVRTRIYAFLNICVAGLVAPQVGDLENIRWADVDDAVRVAELYPETIVGIKIRLSTMLVGANAPEGLRRAAEAARALDKPLMVHPNMSSLSTAEVLDRMRPGDIVTHCYHSRETGIVDDERRVFDAVRRARDEGIWFDVGHGAGSFGFQVAEAALDQGFRPDSISSDLHVYSIEGPVFDLATTAAKFLLLGLSLPDVIAKVTTAPARAMGMEDRLGTLRSGTVADVSVFELQEGCYQYQDTTGEVRAGTQKLVPAAVLRAGESIPVGPPAPLDLLTREDFKRIGVRATPRVPAAQG